DRAHRLTLTSRLGWYRPGTVSRLLGEGRIFEYWAHEACLLPVEDYPLFKRRMLHLADQHWWGRKRQDRETEQHVLDAIRERGALPSRAFEGSGDPGSMWSWKPAKRALEHLFAAGELTVGGRDGFQRLYDLPERVIPREFLEAPTPSEDDFRRGYALRAIEGRGVITESGIAEHCRFRGGAKAMRLIVDGLVADGLVRRVAVEDGGPPVVVARDVELDGSAPAAGVLLSPFDSLLWDKPFVERIFGFRPLIEVYKRGHERIYGYYVLPLLLGDRFAGRADLKADRRAGGLRVVAFHREPGVRASRRLDDAFERALARLARAIGLERVER
ncbi:MAG TPA: crosslink repair DNA glycosylase YcaQ family protein, partial [Gaiellaceae bacterium]|nr:crosslink repair DNA glycosylase YcaQ family protein [Gaiellaceae bacterium]